MDSRVGAVVPGVPNQRVRSRGPTRGSLLLSCLVVVAVLVAMNPQAVAEDDEEKAAIRSGEIAPLEQLLGEIRQRFDGRILKVELDQEWRIGGRIWVYDVKILTPEGEVLKLEYDARSLELIELQRPKSKAVRQRGEH